MDPSPTTSRGARTASRLRSAAREAFAEFGWQGTRVEDIVRRAGVSHGTFYTHYDNKAAVLSELVAEHVAAFDELAALSWEGDARGTLQRVIGGVLDHYADNADVIRTWLEAIRDDDHFRDTYVALRSRFTQRVTEQLEAVVKVAGRTGGPDPEAVASALTAMVERFAYAWQVMGEEHDRDQAVRALVLVWCGTINALAGTELVPVDW